MLINFKRYFNLRIFLLIVVCIILFPLSIFSQSQSDELSVYYPLKVGNVWVYRGMLPEETETYEVIEYVEKHKAYLIENIKKGGIMGDFTAYELIQNQKNKVLRLARGNSSIGLKFLYPAEVVLQSQFKEGKAWNVSNTNDGRMTCKILGFVNLKVAAGDFKDVCKIECAIYLRDKKGKKEKLFGRTYSYFAPSVGLIKEESGSSILKELLEYKIAAEQ